MGTKLIVKVQPRASRNEVGEWLGNALKIRLKAPPVDNAANDALIRFLAKRLKISRQAIRIVSGQRGRTKTLDITGLSGEVINGRLCG